MYTEGTLFDGRYLLKQRKGRGSFGEVWLAEDTEIGVDFAIKIYVAMDPKGLEEFRKEYQLSCNLINSNLLHINKMEVCKEDGCPYLVMPYCPRGASSLMGSLSEQEMWHFVHDVANGLAYLHDQTPPIIHQDIKPDNILQMQSGDYVITDFGISKQLRGTRRSAGGDSSGAVAYMGPERFQRGYTSIKSSDIWSLGATIYEMATAQLPFEGKGGNMQAAGFETPGLPDKYSQELENMMQACMDAEPWNRPSARQIADYAGEMMKGHVVAPPFDVPAAAQTASVNVSVQQAQAVSQPQAVQQPKSSQQSAYTNSEARTERAAGASNKTTLYAACAVAACAVIAILFFVLSGGNDESAENAVADETNTTEQVSVPQPSATTSSQTVTAQSSVQQQATAEPAQSVQNTVVEEAKPETPQNTIASKAASTPEKKETEVKKNEVKETPKTSNTSSNGSLTLSYGKYTGAIKDGYPHGKGKLVYTTSRKINKYDSNGSTASAGDYVEGMFVNGFFTTGKHYSADGELIERITVGVADGVYESK